MRALRLAVLAALVSVSVVDSSTSFARGTGGNGGGAAGGASGGASGGGTGGGAAGGGGFNPSTAFAVIPDPHREPPRRIVIPVVRHSGSCYKEEYLYDSFGNHVVNLHGAECFGG